MNLNRMAEAKSSFLGIPKDIAQIMKKITGNKTVSRLLYYTSPDCLNARKFDDVTSDQLAEMFRTQQISTIPRVQTNKEKKTYLIVSFNNYLPNQSNSFYRDHTIEVRIITHFDIWLLEDYDMRVYRIAGEIDAMLNNCKLSGIGVTNFLSATQDVYDQDFGGLTLTYKVVRGTEDKDENIRPLI